MSTGVGSGRVVVDDISKRGRLSRRLPGGMLDSGLSSLASFASGFLAVHYETTALLGAFALGLSALALSGALTSVLAFTATEAAVVRESAPEQRAASLHRSIPAGARLALGLAIVMAGATLLVPSQVDINQRVELALACIFVSTASPLQDHIRRMLHIGYDSWGAARVSLVQLLVVLAMAGLALGLDLQSHSWVPFVALGVANCVSGLLGLLHVQRAAIHRQDRVVWPGSRASFIFGRELALSCLVTYGSAAAALGIVIAAAGSTDAGEAEGARVLAQPITVIAVGLASALGADLMKAAGSTDVNRLRRYVATILGLLFGLTCAWTALTFRAWSWSPLPRLAPSAYVVPGLLLLTVPSEVIRYSSSFGVQIAQALDGLRNYAAVSVLSSLAGLVVVAVLAKHGAWALGWGGLASGSLLLIAVTIAVTGSRGLKWLATNRLVT